MLITPPRHAPDEQAHFEYVRWMLFEHSLPVYGQSGFTSNARALNPEAFQQPLYYLLALPLFAPFAHQSEVVQYAAVRMFSLICGAATVVLAYCLGRELAPMRPRFALALAAIVGFLPSLMFQSATANNDALVTPLVGALLLVAWRALGQGTLGWRTPLLAGVLLGLGLLAKMTMVIPIGLTVGLLLIYALAQPRGRLTTAARLLVLLGVPIVLFSGWSLVRNWWLYGDPTTFGVFVRFPNLYHAAPFIQQGTLWEMLFVRKPRVIFFWDGVLHGLWGVFDACSIWRPFWFYIALDAVGIVCFVGALRFLLRRNRSRLIERRQLWFGLICAVVFFAMFGSIISRGYKIDYQAQGRYLLPAVVPLALALLVGCEHLAGLVGLRRWAAPLLATLLIALNVSAMVGTLAPSYAEWWRNARMMGSIGEDLVPVFGLQAAEIPFVAASGDTAVIMVDARERIDGPLVVRLSTPGGQRDLAATMLRNLAPGRQLIHIGLRDLGLAADRPYVLSVSAPWNTDQRRLMVSHVVFTEGAGVVDLLQLLHVRGGGNLFTFAFFVLMPLGFLMGVLLVRLLWEGARPRWVWLPLVTVLVVAGAAPPEQTPLDLNPAHVDVAFSRKPMLRRPGQQALADLILLGGSRSTVFGAAQQSDRLPQVAALTIGGSDKASLLMPSQSAITYTLALTGPVRLQAELAVPDGRGSLAFTAALVRGGERRALFRRCVEDVSTWHPMVADLGHLDGEQVQLVLSASPCGAGAAVPAWGAWGVPKLVSQPE